jgi:Kef-type K+ transport system membrane component KefB
MNRISILLSSAHFQPIELPLTEPIYILSVLLLIIWLGPILARHLRLPPLVVLILLGALFGDNFLGIISRDDQLILLEKMGLLYIMLLAGIQMNLSNFKQLRTRALIFGLLTFSIPLIIGIFSGILLENYFLTSLLLGILYSPHTLVAYPMMNYLGIIQQEAIAVAVGGTIVTSILTLIAFSVLQAIASESLGAFLWIKLLILLPIFIASCLWFIPQFGRFFLKKQESFLQIEFIFILSCLFVVASITQLLGIDAIVGAFIAGLALNPVLKGNIDLIKQVDFVGNSLFIPMFLVSVGVLCNLAVLWKYPENIGMALMIVAGAIGSKFLAAWIAGKQFHYTVNETMVMFGLTLSRAALVLVIALFGRKAGLVNEGLFNAIILYIIMTCIVGPLIVDAYGKKLVFMMKKPA